MKNRNILILIILGIITFFVNNNAIFPDIMESRNIITAREMVYEGNWMVPTMNGELRLEKPPLPTWIAAFAEHINPDNIMLQRAMAGLAALLLLIFFYKLAYEFTRNNKFAFISSLVLITSYSIILMGRTASWDIYCHAFMLGGIYYLFKSLKKDGSQMGGFALSGLFMGLSFLSKGPVSFFALLFPFLISLPFLKDLKFKNKAKSLILLIIIMVMISTWWYIILLIYHHDKVIYILNKESGAWVNHNVRPWYYYNAFFFETGIWALILLTAIFLPVFRGNYKISKENKVVLLWLILQLILLSCIPEKKNRYLLPILIPCSYITGFLLIYWDKISGQISQKIKKFRWDKILYKFNSYFITFLITILPFGFYFSLYSKGYMSLCILCISTLVFWTISIYMFINIRKNKVLTLVYGVVALFAFIEIAIMPYVGDLANNPDINSISQTKEIKKLKDLKFYNLKNEELRIEIVYAVNKRIRPIDIKDSITLKKTVPFVLLSHNPINEVLSKNQLKKYKIEYIGSYDDNHRPKHDKHHSTKFDYNVNIIMKRK